MRGLCLLLALILCLSPGPGAAGQGGLYPAVPPVDLAAPGGSLQFPEGNWGAQGDRKGLEGYKAILSQSDEGLDLPSAGVPQAFFAIIRLPADKRDSGYSMGVFGNDYKLTPGGGKLQLTLLDPESRNRDMRDRFRFYYGGGRGDDVTLISPPWTEDAALVVAWHDGGEQWGLDWYSLADGSRRAGPPVSRAGAGPVRPGVFDIGTAGNFTRFEGNVHPAWAKGSPGGDRIRPWPGEIEALGYLSGARVPPEDWARIARGAPLRDVLPVEAVRWLREFDGTPASLAAPGWARADATPPSRPLAGATPDIPDTRLVPGSTFRRQSPGQYVLIDQGSAGMVHGLMPGQGERPVAFSGASSGPVEIRVYEAETGRVVRDWTAMDRHADGRWSGSLVLPESTNGWLFADARLAAAPDVVARGRDVFGVGYKFMIMGQSQTAFPLGGTTSRLEITAPMSASTAGLAKLGSRTEFGAAARRPILRRIGADIKATGDGMVSFLNQFRVLKPRTPFMILREAVPGTSMAALMSGETGNVDRSWADLRENLDHFGHDVTAVLFNWAMNESEWPTQLMEDMFLPARIGRRPHSLAAELQPGWTLGVLGSDRGTDSGQRSTDRRAARIAFAHAHGFHIGPMVSDYRINDAGGGHPGLQFTSPAGGAAGEYAPPETFDNGMARFMQRMAVMALQTIGEIPDSAVHPYYRNARFSADRRTILVDAVAVNGGRIWSPAPQALRSWLVGEPGDAQPVPVAEKGAVAVLNTAASPPRVEISRATPWPSGTRVIRPDASEARASNDGAAEDAIHAGGIYESWDKDPLGFGFPVVGTLDPRGRWQSVFDVRLR